jgi:hypothetical protein
VLHTEVEVEIRPTQSETQTIPITTYPRTLLIEFHNFAYQVSKLNEQMLDASLERIRELHSLRAERDAVSKQIEDYLTPRLRDGYRLVRWRLMQVPVPDPPGGSD